MLAGCFIIILPYLKGSYKLNRIDLRKEQTLDVDTKAISQSNFKGNLEHAGLEQWYLLSKKLKKISWISHKELHKHCKHILHIYLTSR